MGHHTNNGKNRIGSYGNFAFIGIFLVNLGASGRFEPELCAAGPGYPLQFLGPPCGGTCGISASIPSAGIFMAISSGKCKITGGIHFFHIFC